MDDKEKIRKMKKTLRITALIFSLVYFILYAIFQYPALIILVIGTWAFVFARVDVGAGDSGLVIQEYRSMGELKYLVQEHSTSLTRWCLHHAWKAEFEWERGHCQVHF